MSSSETTIRSMILDQLSTISRKVDEMSQVGHANAVKIAGMEERVNSIYIDMGEMKRTVDWVKRKLGTLSVSEAKLTTKIAALAAGASLVVVALFELLINKVMN